MTDTQYIPVVAVDELPPGERLLFDLDDYSIVLLNVSGKFYAVADKCTHDDGPIGDGEVIGMEIVCPRHGARFSLLNGDATRLPAVVKIDWFPVRINEGMVEVGLPPL